MFFRKKPFAGAYNEIAEEFASTRTRDWGEFTFFAPYLKKGAKVLDLGCGSGRAIPFLQKTGAEVEAFDSSESLLAIARQNNPRVKFTLGRMEEGLPYADETFDVVLAVASFHHLLDVPARERALAEIHRVLKKDGKLLFTTWHLLDQAKYQKILTAAKWRARFLPWWRANDLLVPFGKAKTSRFYHSFVPGELRDLLTNNFFAVEALFGARGDQKTSWAEAHNLCVIATKVSRKQIVGVDFDIISSAEALRRLHALALSGKQAFVATPNPEMCVEAAHNPEFARALAKVNLSLADGTGIIWAAKTKAKSLLGALFSLLGFFFSRKKIGNFERTQGSDVFREFCLTTSAKVFLLGGVPGVAEKCGEYFQERNSRFQFAGADDGSAKPFDDDRLVQKITASGAEVLFVAFGAPAQELWLARNLPRLLSIRFGMGVGGSFDFIVGVQKRAPRVLQTLGLEWLWRLLTQPKRLKRIWNATAGFVRLAIKSLDIGNANAQK